MRRKSDKVKDIEQQYGERLETLLVRLLNENGSQTEVWQALGVSKGSVTNWMLKEDIQWRCAAVPKGHDLVLVNARTGRQETLLSN